MKIGHLELGFPICLAPMEDVTDRSFRLTCRELGADVVYTEFTHSEALRRGVVRALEKIRVLDEERPVAVQIFGSESEAMAESARVAEEAGPDFLDINCGCWVKKVARRGEGAGLLRDLKAFERVVKAVVKATRMPVTVKTRLGWDAESIVILDVARMLEANGVAALTVHCRTRAQGHAGKADWSWLARLKDTVAIPIIGNGDVFTPADAERMQRLGVDGIMIGRGAIANPWIFEQIKHYLRTGELMPEPAPARRVDMCLRHLQRKIALRGERRGVIEFRKHYTGYLRGLRGAKEVRLAVMAFEQYEPIAERLLEFARRIE
ncbi:MAG: tRNA dihydrouridine synthase DusB [Candidatus Sumerlaeia bacterium]